MGVNQNLKVGTPRAPCDAELLRELRQGVDKGKPRKNF
jgi:hypothetical protein